MNRILAFAVILDGTMKRISITYDEVDGEGKVTGGNRKLHRVIVDPDAAAAADALMDYAATLLDSAE